MKKKKKNPSKKKDSKVSLEENWLMNRNKST